jgi:hypothetical protein
VAVPQQPIAVADTTQTASTEYCREYTSKAIIDGKTQVMTGTACQQPDGRWRLVDGAAPPQDGTQQANPPPTVVYPYPYPYFYPYYYPYPYYYGPTVGIFFHGHFHHHY